MITMKNIFKIIFKILAIIFVAAEMVVLFIPNNQVFSYVFAIAAGLFEIIASTLDIPSLKEANGSKTFKKTSARKHLPFSTLTVTLIMVSLAISTLDILIGTIVSTLSFVAAFIIYYIYQKKGFRDEISPLQRFFIIFALIVLLIVYYIKICLGIDPDQRGSAFAFYGIHFGLVLLITIIIIIVLRKKNSPMKFLLTFVANSIAILATYILNGIGTFGLINNSIPFSGSVIFSSLIALGLNALIYIITRIPVSIVEKTVSVEKEEEKEEEPKGNPYHNTIYK